MIKIRLARKGTTNRPYYWIVAADSRAPRDGKFIEKLGDYDPLKEEGEKARVNAERVAYWESVGGQSTSRVKKILSSLGLLEGYRPQEQSKKSQMKAKSLERLREREEKLKAVEGGSDTEEVSELSETEGSS